MAGLYRYLFVGIMLMLNLEEVSAQQGGVAVSQLPQRAKDFLKIHYSSMKVASISNDIKSFFKDSSYHVILQDGKHIAFDGEGNWQEVDGRWHALPRLLVPDSVQGYIARSFPRNEVVRMRRDDNKFLVAISNGLELEFNKKGKFIKINQQ